MMTKTETETETETIAGTNVKANADLAALPDLPRDAEGPVFNEPWEAQAFAMTLKLHDAGHFTWPEWAEMLAREISAAKTLGEADLGDTYYHHWLNALEKIVVAKNILGAKALRQRKDAWQTAAAAAPHGDPILLNAAARGASRD